MTWSVDSLLFRANESLPELMIPSSTVSGHGSTGSVAILVQVVVDELSSVLGKASRLQLVLGGCSSDIAEQGIDSVLIAADSPSSRALALGLGRAQSGIQHRHSSVLLEHSFP